MSDTTYKKQSFLLPILSFVILLIIVIASINAYITINMFQTFMDNKIKTIMQEYTSQHKERVKKEVYFVKDTIEYEIQTIETKLKANLQEKIEIALNIVENIYNQNKNTLSKDAIQKKIADTLSLISFHDERGYFFMYDTKTNIMFGHKIKKFLNKDMSNFKDVKGSHLLTSNAKVLEGKKIAFNKIYFNKPNSQNVEYPKVTCLGSFEPLDIVVGTGEYLDIIENQAKKSVIERFSNPLQNKRDKYLVILDIHDLRGGDDFATVLVNSNRTELVGNRVSDKGKDAKGNRFRKNFLDLIKAKGEGFSEYWYKKPSTGLPASKMSYVYFQKDWNWLILNGFYYEDLEKQIIQIKQEVKNRTQETIRKTLLWAIALSLLVIIIAVIISLKIDKTIKKYTDTIITYENNKRKQEAKLVEQSKLASMGQMMTNIAHQWRQPLATISMTVNNILVDIELNTIDNKELKKNSKEIIEQTEYLSKTINDFRDFIKGDKEKTVFNLKENIDNFIHLVQSSIKNNDIQIVLDVKDDIFIQGYQNQLIQCWINIFHNAKDAFLQNDIKERLLFITTLQEGAHVSIKIKDNAGGIQKEIINKIFEPYFTTKHEAQGTGIGLHMSYNLIVKSMAGNIEANNVEYVYNRKNYNGAEFTITLPTN